MTPEGKLKQQIKEYLDSLGDDCWYFLPMNMGYGKVGVPDFIICYKGRFLAPETKRVGGKSQPWQERQQTAIRLAGGRSARVTDLLTIQYWVRAIDALQS